MVPDFFSGTPSHGGDRRKPNLNFCRQRHSKQTAILRPSWPQDDSGKAAATVLPLPSPLRQRPPPQSPPHHHRRNPRRTPAHQALRAAAGGQVILRPAWPQDDSGKAAATVLPLPSPLRQRPPPQSPPHHQEGVTWAAMDSGRGITGTLRVGGPGTAHRLLR